MTVLYPLQKTFWELQLLSWPFLLCFFWWYIKDTEMKKRHIWYFWCFCSFVVLIFLCYGWIHKKIVLTVFVISQKTNQFLQKLRIWICLAIIIHDSYQTLKRTVSKTGALEQFSVVYNSDTVLPQKVHFGKSSSKHVINKN